MTVCSSVEGGSGSQTYCAPMNIACAGKNPFKPNPINTDSEQDWQRKAHGILRASLRSLSIIARLTLHFQNGLNRLRPGKISAGVYLFRFNTAFLPTQGAYATMVQYYLPVVGIQESQYSNKWRRELNHLIPRDAQPGDILEGMILVL